MVSFSSAGSCSRSYNALHRRESVCALRTTVPQNPSCWWLPKCPILLMALTYPVITSFFPQRLFPVGASIQHCLQFSLAPMPSYSRWTLWFRYPLMSLHCYRKINLEVIFHFYLLQVCFCLCFAKTSWGLNINVQKADILYLQKLISLCKSWYVEHPYPVQCSDNCISPDRAEQESRAPLILTKGEEKAY